MRLTATALTQSLSARIQVKTYPISLILPGFHGELTLTKLNYLMDIANDLDHLVRAVIEID
jgi:hypothetical protein